MNTPMYLPAGVALLAGVLAAAPAAEAHTHTLPESTATMVRTSDPLPIDAPGRQIGQMQMDPAGGGGMEMGGMMLRPDMAPPAGIMGTMSPPQGKFMLSFSYMSMSMDGNRDGTDQLSTDEVLDEFLVAPLNMDVDMFMLAGMYGITDDISAMAMVPFLRKEMDHRTRMDASFTTRSSGIGDIRILGGYSLWAEMGHTVKLTGGLSLPTGSTDERDATPADPDAVLPYPMQLGSGTFDLLPGLAYTGSSGEWSWGGQLGAAVRLGENDDDYTLGNQYQGSLWAARKWTDWFSTSLRVSGEIVEDIDGADPRLNPAMVPTADPDLRAGRFIGLGLGANFIVPSGPLTGVRLSVEGTVPVYQWLDGPQVERDYAVIVGLSKAF